MCGFWSREITSLSFIHCPMLGTLPPTSKIKQLEVGSGRDKINVRLSSGDEMQAYCSRNAFILNSICLNNLPFSAECDMFIPKELMNMAKEQMLDFVRNFPGDDKGLIYIPLSFNTDDRDFEIGALRELDTDGTIRLISVAEDCAVCELGGTFIESK